MSPEQLDAEFDAVVEDVLGWEVELGEDDGPATVETWDSLAQVRLVHELETRLGVRLPDATLLEQHTVGSLRALVHDHARAA